MNQAQFTGERMLRGDAYWSPLPAPLLGIADALTKCAGEMFDATELSLLSVLREQPAPIGFAQAQKLCPNAGRDRIYRALHSLVIRGMVRCLGQRGHHVYEAVQ